MKKTFLVRAFYKGHNPSWTDFTIEAWDKEECKSKAAKRVIPDENNSFNGRFDILGYWEKTWRSYV